MLVTGNRLVLPTQEHLANSNKSNIVIFHPLSESLLKGESDVLEKFRASLVVRINYVLHVLTLHLLKIASHIDEHASLTPEQSDFLSHVKNVDKKTVDDFAKVCEQFGEGNSQKNFVSIFLKRGGKVRGTTYSRCGIVHFPLYEALTKSEHECYGVKLRVKDIKSLISLMDYIFPGIDKPETYNIGTESQLAPYLDALMKTVGVVASNLNTIIELFRNTMEDEADELLFESEWEETFDNIEVMKSEIRLVPMQAGNEGKSLHTDVGTTPAAAATSASFASAPVTNLQPWQVPPQQPQNTYGQPAQSYQPAPVVTENGGLDFNSLIRSVPSLRSVIGAPNNVQQYQQGQSRSGMDRPAGLGGIGRSYNTPSYGNNNYGNRNGGFGAI